MRGLGFWRFADMEYLPYSARNLTFSLITKMYIFWFKMKMEVTKGKDQQTFPYFLHHNLYANSYEKYLKKGMCGLLKDMTLEIRYNMLEQHDGCLARYLITVTKRLLNHFPRRCIWRRGSILWLAWNPDLIPSDCYILDHMKSFVYDVALSVSNFEELRQRIANAAE